MHKKDGTFIFSPFHTIHLSQLLICFYCTVVNNIINDEIESLIEDIAKSSLQFIKDSLKKFTTQTILDEDFDMKLAFFKKNP